jgi:hypothetical protein
MATPTAGELEDRIRKWLTSYNRQILTPEDIYGLMNEAANELVQLFDIWFCKVWGSRVRDADNAIWDTEAIVPPTKEDGSPLTAVQIAAGDVPVNVPYLRAVPFPERLQRPYRAYYGTIEKTNELAFLMEDEFEVDYDFSSSGNTPEAYAASGDSILLGPTPGFDVTLWVQGYYLPEQLVDDSDENAFTRHGHTLLVYATQNLIIKYNYEEEERADLFAKEYGRALRAALAQSGRVGDVARQSRFQRKG